jgi:peptidyl-dipeptidase A
MWPNTKASFLQNQGEEFCDPATKTHINDDPASYYDYALAGVIRFQLHDYIARHILKQDPHNCSYYGNKEVGKFLTDILSWAPLVIGAN